MTDTAASPRIKVLLIEDDARYAEFIREVLAAERAYAFDVTSCDGLMKALKLLIEDAPDVVLTDLTLPDSRGPETFLNLYSHASSVPVVILTGTEDEQLALESVRKGAQDYLFKSRIDTQMLSRVLRYAIERKKIERRIHFAEMKYRTIFENSAVAILLADERDRIVSWNRFTEVLFGAEREDLAEKPIAAFYADEKDATPLTLPRRQAGGAETRKIECRMKKKSGEVLDAEMSVSVFRSPENRIVGSILIIKDITDHKRLSRLKDEFVSMVSHELRTPMAIIREGVSQVSEGILGKINDEQKEFLSITLENIDRLGRIIEDLLDISKIEAGRLKLKKELVDLAALGRSAASAFRSRAEAKGLKLIERYPRDAPEVYADRDKIIQVFTNLFGNALRFTDKGSITAAIEEKNGGFECSVTDTGKGIARENLPKMFEKFMQFDPPANGEKGTGLGLAICKGIVEAHRGEIRVESRPKGGALFAFTLPKYDARELLRERLSRGLDEAVKNQDALSAVLFTLRNFDAIEKRMGPRDAGSLIQRIDQVIKANVYRRSDVTLKGKDFVLLLLAGTEKKDAATVMERLRESVARAAETLQRGEPPDIECRLVSFPEDATREEFPTRVLP